MILSSKIKMEWDGKQPICRVCLKVTGEFQTIFTSINTDLLCDKKHISEMICSFSNIQITLGDGLPEQICYSCVTETLKVYVFKKRCEESDKFLRQRILQHLENNVTKCHSKDYSAQHFNDNDFDTAVNLSDDNSETGNEDLVTYLYPIQNSELATTQLECDPLDATLEIQTKPSNNEKSNITIVKSALLIGNFSCNLCKCDFVNEADLEKHLEGHYNSLNTNNYRSGIVVLNPENCPPLFSCSLCESIFVAEINFDKHLKEHLHTLNKNEVNSFICKFCGKPIESIEIFKKHIKFEHTRPKTPTETPVPLKYPNDVLNINQPKHLSSVSSKTSSSKRELKSNSKKKNSNNKKKSSKRKPHVCEICLKAFNQISNLNDHIRTHNGEKPFLCPTCGKGFNQLGNLRQHQVRHSGVKPYICSICNNAFASKGELRAHSRKHTGVKPFVCNTCGAGFSTSSSLTKHKRIHSGEKPYKCEVCNLKFSRSGILSRHRRTHTGVKPHVCKFCKKSFTQAFDMNAHLRIHTGEKPFACDICEQSFRQNTALRRHKKTHKRSGYTVFLNDSSCEPSIKPEQHNFVNNMQEQDTHSISF